MNTEHVIEVLNQTIALELTASLQYHQHALLVRGPWRKLFAEFFHAESHGALDHAHKFGQKVAALGGVPTIEVGAPVRQSLDLTEMLHQDLELERQAMQAYVHRIGKCIFLCDEHRRPVGAPLRLPLCLKDRTVAR